MEFFFNFFGFEVCLPDISLFPKNCVGFLPTVWIDGATHH